VRYERVYNLTSTMRPIVVVPKKNGKLRICVDFRCLNNVTQKDYLPLPFTDAILDGLAGYECYSFLDGFLGYNQIMIALACRITRPLLLIRARLHTTLCHSVCIMPQPLSKE
jgi:hypothetical protein